ncbi:MAG: DJ-1/PfpI family protein [Clostridia bacterium]|nr:DJ-1/PfpI family protein [Clostridia bacterium]
MKKIALIFANGTEEIEALTPVDILRRCDETICDIISISGLTPKGSHGITITADKLIENFNIEDYDGIIIPGGMPGAVNIANCKPVIDGLKLAFSQNKMVASICASPAVVLAENGLINGKKATCYPLEKFTNSLKQNCVYTGSGVEEDGNLITSNGIVSAFEFSIAICKVLGLTPKM